LAADQGQVIMVKKKKRLTLGFSFSLFYDKQEDLLGFDTYL